jgi:hypothetical protein
MAVSCKHGDEPAGSGATELVSYLVSYYYHKRWGTPSPA